MPSIKKDFSVTKGIEVQGSIKVGNSTVTSVVDSASVTQIVQDSSVASSITAAGGLIAANYDSADLLPAVGNSTGDFGFVNSTNRLYLWNGIGWYNIALVNTTPTFDSGGSPNSSYTLDSAGASLSITILASDPEEVPITYSHVASDSASDLVTISQSANVFSVSPLTQAQLDSNGVGSGGTFTITFKASDGINIVPAVSSFTLTIGVSYDWSTATQQALIQGSDISTGSYYGWDVDISDDGNYGIVGIYHGAVYIHTRSGSTWSQQQKITLTGENGARLGQAVAIDADGDTVVFGDWMGESAGGGSQGAAFVWTRSGSTWTQQAKLVSSDIQGDDKFGVSVAISDDGNTIVIGAGGEDTEGTDAGAAYVFTRSGSTWTQQQKLTASDAAASDGFGGDQQSVSISGDGNTIVVGAKFESSNVGAAYVFTVSGSTWSQHSKLTPSDTSNSLYFGEATHIDKDGDTIIVGAFYNNNPSTQIGAAYIFTLSGGTWSQQARLQHSEASSGFRDRFGCDVNLTDDGNTALIGAHQDNSDDGTCWIFTRSESTWSEVKKLQPSVTVTDGQFGFSCSISGDGSTALIGSQQDASGGTGRAYIFIGSSA